MDLNDADKKYVFGPRSLTSSQLFIQSVNAIELDVPGVNLGILKPPQPFTAPTLAALEAWLITWSLSNDFETAQRGGNTKSAEGQIIIIYVA